MSVIYEKETLKFTDSVCCGVYNIYRLKCLYTRIILKLLLLVVTVLSTIEKRVEPKTRPFLGEIGLFLAHHREARGRREEEEGGLFSPERRQQWRGSTTGKVLGTLLGLSLLGQTASSSLFCRRLVAFFLFLFFFPSFLVVLLWRMVVCCVFLEFLGCNGSFYAYSFCGHFGWRIGGEWRRGKYLFPEWSIMGVRCLNMLYGSALRLRASSAPLESQ